LLLYFLEKMEYLLSVYSWTNYNCSHFKGAYKEAIQFQCLERGGVRVFEGINFMSRNPVMTDDELTAMHARAEKAGMYPYGAAPEQMHRVERYPLGAEAVDNNWQKMWRAIGVDKLLKLLTEAIEDGGR